MTDYRKKYIDFCRIVQAKLSTLDNLLDGEIDEIQLSLALGEKEDFNLGDVSGMACEILNEIEDISESFDGLDFLNE